MSCTAGSSSSRRLLATLGKRLNGAVRAYNETVGSYEARVLPGARRFADHGAVAEGSELPQPGAGDDERAERAYPRGREGFDSRSAGGDADGARRRRPARRGSGDPASRCGVAFGGMTVRSWRLPVRRRRSCVSALSVAAAWVALGCAASAAAPVWGAARQLSLPAGAAGSGQDAALESVACPRVGDCVTVGSYSERGGGGPPTVIAQRRAGWARGSELPLPFGAGAGRGAQQAVLESVSCWRVGACVAVGYYTDAHGNAEPMVLGESAGRWGVPVELMLPANAAPTGQNSALTRSRAPGAPGAAWRSATTRM